MNHLFPCNLNKKMVLFFFSFAIFFLPKQILANELHICQSQYALCTSAKCTPIPGQEKSALCNCNVETGYSVGFKPCDDAKTDKNGDQLLKSRYYPLTSYRICSNKRPWANCIDRPCIIDKDDPSKAQCTCSIEENQGPYILTCDNSCDSDLYSSALLNVSEKLFKQLENQDKVPSALPTVCK